MCYVCACVGVGMLGVQPAQPRFSGRAVVLLLGRNFCDTVLLRAVACQGGGNRGAATHTPYHVRAPCVCVCVQGGDWGAIICRAIAK